MECGVNSIRNSELPHPCSLLYRTAVARRLRHRGHLALAQVPNRGASCRSCPKRAFRPLASQASAATVPVWPSSRRVTCRVFKSQIQMRLSRAAGGQRRVVQEHECIDFRRARLERCMRASPVATSKMRIVGAVPGRGKLPAVRRECQAADSPPVGLDVPLARAVGHVPNSNLRRCGRPRPAEFRPARTLPSARRRTDKRAAGSFGQTTC